MAAKYTKEITTNNSITFPINLKNLSFIPLKPVDNQVVNGDTITWKFHNVERPFYYGSGGSLNMDKVVPDLRVTIYYGVY